MKPSDDYIPQITRPKAAWITTNRFPDYGPVVEDDLITNTTNTNITTTKSNLNN